MKLTPVGIDIAKNVMQMHYVDEGTGEVVNKPIKRAQFLEYFRESRAVPDRDGGLRRVRITWARQLTKMGHQVKLMPAQFVKAFNIRNKNDAADARAIWLAVRQSPASSVAVKTEMQQAMLALHRTRERMVAFRTMQINGLRGMLTEYGEVMGKGRAAITKAIPGSTCTGRRSVARGTHRYLARAVEPGRGVGRTDCPYRAANAGTGRKTIAAVKAISRDSRRGIADGDGGSRDDGRREGI